MSLQSSAQVMSTIALLIFCNSSGGSVACARSATPDNSVSQILIADSRRRACSTSEKRFLGDSDVRVSVEGASASPSGRTLISTLSPTESATPSQVDVTEFGSSDLSYATSQTRFGGSFESIPWLRFTCALSQPSASSDARTIGRSLTESDRRIGKILHCVVLAATGG